MSNDSREQYAATQYKALMDSRSQAIYDTAQRKTSDSRLTLRSLIDGLAYLKLVRAEYVTLGFPAPKALDEEIETLIRRAKAKYREELEGELQSVKRKAEELKSKEKQREDAEKEIERISALLAG